MNGTTSEAVVVPEVDARQGFAWSTGGLTMQFAFSPATPVVVSSLEAGPGSGTTTATQPLVELMLTGDGRARNNTRFTNTGGGSRLRYVDHVVATTGDVESLSVVQRDDLWNLRTITTFTASADLPAVRVTTTVVNEGDQVVIVEAISSVALGALVYADESTKDLVLWSGTGEQLAENRWTRQNLWGQTTLGDFNSAFHNQPGRGSVHAVGTSTWSTARALPTAVLENARSGRALAWQIEHNGGWRWEVDDVRTGEDSVGLVLMGPEDLDHHWSQALAPSDEFTSVPVSVAVSDGGFEGAVAELTRHRRWLRRDQSADRGSLLVFNDYMNTINGDPTTQRLLPLIAQAADAGAECFCIDAGWYDDTDDGGWWPSVGEWQPSVRRFPGGGLTVVTDAIRAAGMTVGLWLEPEVVGVRSPLAAVLPDEAFLQRHGRRVVEHERYFLDLRHPAARAHLDATVDRLVSDFGVGFFKFDYNVTPGPGTDLDAFSVGAGLLGHNRAHLAWLKDVRRRHPGLVIENCSSGGMRADFAMLEVLDIQSTSDQEDFRLYPVIAAAAPLQMLPEQAGNWAYPQAWMSDEEIAYTMVTGLSGRLYMSGFLDAMSKAQLALVHDAAAEFKDIRPLIARSTPGWPMGLPQWYGESLALTLTTRDQTLVYVWHRGDRDAELTVRLGPSYDGCELTELYPRTLTPWAVENRTGGEYALRPGIAGTSARVYSCARP